MPNCAKTFNTIPIICNATPAVHSPGVPNGKRLTIFYKQCLVLIFSTS